MEEEKMFDGFDISNLLEVNSDTIEIKEESQKTSVQGVEKPVENKPIDDGKIEIPDFNSQVDNNIIEEEEPTEKKEEIPSTPSDEGKSFPSSSPYLAFAKLSSEEGVFNNFTEEEWNELVEENGSEIGALVALQNQVIEEELSKREQSFVNSLTDEDRQIFNAKRNGLPLDEFGEIQRNKKIYNTISQEKLESNEELQEQVVRKDLALRGFSEDEIEDTVTAYKDTDKLHKYSKSALNKINNHYETREKYLVEQREQKQKLVEQQKQEQLNYVTQTIEGTQEIVPGMKLNKKSRERIMHSMTTPVAKDTEGNLLNAVMANRIKNPIAFEMALHYYNDLGLFNIDEKGLFKPDFSKIINKATTDATRTFRKVVESNEGFKGGDSSIKPVSSNKDVEKQMSEGFKNFDKLFNNY